MSRTGRPLTKRYCPSAFARVTEGEAAKPSSDDAVALGAHVDGGSAEIGAENVAEPRQASGAVGQRRRPRDLRALLAGQREGDVGPRHRKPAHHLADGFRLGAVGLQEFQPRGRRIEEIGDLDARAVIERARLRLRFLAALDRKRPGMRLRRMTRGDGQFRDRADRGQGLAAEAERPDAQQVFVVELRGGVALDREVEVAARHAAAIIGDGDAPPPAALGENVDPARAGIDRILDQLLDDARRAFDHLAGGDAVDERFGQLADGHGGPISR